MCLLSAAARSGLNPRPRWGTGTPYPQVLNVYDRRNVLFYFYNYDRMPPTRSGISIFPVLPTVGVDVTF